MSSDNAETNEPPHRLRCWHCGHEVSTRAQEVRRYKVYGFPLCCGTRMVPRKLRAAPPLPHFPDRLGRRWSAHPRIRVRISRSNGEPIAAVEAGLLNVSMEGAGFRLTIDVEVGKRMQFELRRKQDHDAIEVVGEVRWCRPAGGGIFVVGVRFERPLTAQELSRLTL